MATNGQLIIGSKFTPRSLQDRIAAYLDYFTNAKAALKEREDYIIKSLALRNYLDPMADRNFILKIDDYDKQLDEIASDMAIGGYTNSVYNKALQAKKIYSGDLLNIERLYNIREKERERFNKMRESAKGTFMYAMDPYSTSLDEMYAKGNDLNIGYMRDSNDFFLRGQEIGKGFNNTAAYARSTITEADLNGITGILTKKVQSHGRGEKDFRDLLGEEDLSKLSPTARNLYKDLADAAQKEIESGAPDKYKEDIIKELKRGVAAALHLQLDETVHFDRDHSGGGSSGGGMGLILQVPYTGDMYNSVSTGLNIEDKSKDFSALFPVEAGGTLKVVVGEDGTMYANSVRNPYILNDQLEEENQEIREARKKLKEKGFVLKSLEETKTDIALYIKYNYIRNPSGLEASIERHRLLNYAKSAYKQEHSEDTLLSGVDKNIGAAFLLKMGYNNRVRNTKAVYGHNSKESDTMEKLKSALAALYQRLEGVVPEYSFKEGLNLDKRENLQNFTNALENEKSVLNMVVYTRGGEQYAVFEASLDGLIHDVLMNPRNDVWREGLSFSNGVFKMMTLFSHVDEFRPTLGTFLGGGLSSDNTFTSKTGIKGVIDKFAEVASKYYDSQAIDSTGQPTDFSRTVTSLYGSKEQFIEYLKQDIQNNLSNVGIKGALDAKLTSFLMKALSSNDETKKYIINGGSGNNLFMMLNIAVSSEDDLSATNVYKIGLQYSGDATSNNMTLHTNNMKDYYAITCGGKSNSFEIKDLPSQLQNYDVVNSRWLMAMLIQLAKSERPGFDTRPEKETVQEARNRQI